MSHIVHLTEKWVKTNLNQWIGPLFVMCEKANLLHMAKMRETKNILQKKKGQQQHEIKKGNNFQERQDPD